LGGFGFYGTGFGRAHEALVEVKPRQFGNSNGNLQPVLQGLFGKAHAKSSTLKK
jgi:hypothetical protein